MNNNHAGILRLTCILKLYFPAFVGNRSGIFFVYSGENLHQRRFSGTVLSHKSVYFAASYLKVYMIQRMNTRKRFVDTLHCKNYVTHSLLLSSVLLAPCGNICVYGNNNDDTGYDQLNILAKS